MNQIFKLIWSRAQGALIVVSECARGGGRKSASRRRGTRLLPTPGLLIALVIAPTPPAFADGTLPSGGQVVSGAASISQSGNAMTVNQSTDKMIANWQSFSIGADASVRFNQPGASAVALNRVVGQDPSRILGSLSANGQVFLINPNGVIFGRGAQVQTGAFITSTLGIANEDFLAGRYNFTGKGGAILNQGTLKGQVVALIAPSVTNEGTISGDTALAAGTDVLLDFDGDGLISVEVKASTLAGLVDNKGLIQADGGTAILTAKGASDALKGIVNNTGTVQAQTLANKNGRILLLADMDHGTVKADGTLSAHFVETSAAKVDIAETLKVETDGGEWLIDPVDLLINTDAATALNAALAGSTNVTMSTAGSGSAEGNITVAAPVTWSKNKLTLHADKDITINAALNGSGTAGLALEYAQSNSAGDYYVNAPVNLASTGSFSTKKGSEATKNYTIITSLGAAGSTTGTDLQGIYGDAFGNYVLGADIDASATAAWNDGKGFNPIGGDWDSSSFTGIFDGLGHVIRNLSINRPSSSRVALFGSIEKGGIVQNLGLVDGSVVGYGGVGMLAGHNFGTVRYVYATGNVSNDNNLSSGSSDGGGVGGLVGINLGDVKYAYATGTVTGSFSVGGLVGLNKRGIFTNGNISHAYATGNINGRWDRIGGLVGENTSTVQNAYATGAIDGNKDVGGLVGWNNGTVRNTYATGAVSASSNRPVGGLVGRNSWDGIVQNSYATGLVSSGSYSGGLVGYSSGTVDASFYDNQTTGQSSACGGYLNCSGTGLTTAQMKTLSTFTDAGWNFSTVWDMQSGENGGYPILRGLASIGAILTPLPTPTPGDTDRLFNWAESIYPSLFPKSAVALTQTYLTYTYRYYPASGLYLATGSGRVIVHGGPYNLLDVGAVSSYLPLAAAAGF